MTQPPADWYPDPAGSGQLRYFDGKVWTDFYHGAPADPESRSSRGGLTADDVHNVAFSAPPIGRRGYHEDQVDAFLERVEQQLRHPQTAGGLTAADVRNVSFSKPPFGKRGYNVDEVDAFLDVVEQALRP